MIGLPFTRGEFVDVFARYNESVWPMQVVLLGLAIAALALLALRHPQADRAISSVLALLWAWMAVAYFLRYFWDINRAAPLFALVSLAGGWMFAWHGVLRCDLHYGGTDKPSSACAWLLIAYAVLFYPLLSATLGHRYPQAPTFGLPCPTTIFTLGVLLLLRPAFPRRVFIAPLVWAPIGVLAAVYLEMGEDFALLPAGLAGIMGALRPFRPSTV